MFSTVSGLTWGSDTASFWFYVVCSHIFTNTSGSDCLRSNPRGPLNRECSSWVTKVLTNSWFYLGSCLNSTNSIVLGPLFMFLNLFLKIRARMRHKINLLGVQYVKKHSFLSLSWKCRLVGTKKWVNHSHSVPSVSFMSLTLSSILMFS